MPQVGAALVAGFTTFGTAGAATAGAVAAGLGVSTAFSVGAFFATTAGKLLASVAISAISSALQKQPEIQRQGIRTDATTQGGTNPATFPIGRYCTEGNLVCPPMSHGKDNWFQTIIIDLSDTPITSLLRVAIDGEWSELGDLEQTGGEAVGHPEYGFPLLAKREVETKTRRIQTNPEVSDPSEREYRTEEYDITWNHAWVKFYDGTQTEADPMLLDKYADHDERPWSADMVGVGVAYAIVTIKFNSELWRSTPTLRFEVEGVPMYDPRSDSSVGGSGSQRWADSSTWAVSHNPMVQCYNIARGIALPNGRTYGGGFGADDLPLSNWFAAMNECDLTVDDGDGGTEPQYRAGFELAVNTDPASVMEEIGKACSAKFCEYGGRLYTRCGASPLPSVYITTDDILLEQQASQTPFPSLSETYNGARGSYVAPDEVWAAKDAPGNYDADMLADDAGQEHVADIDFTTVYSGSQVQRLLSAWLKDSRRFKRHTMALGAAFVALQPMQVVAWTDEGNGYTSKHFEIGQTVRAAESATIALSLREVDPGDFTPFPEQILPIPPSSPTVVVPPPVTFENLTVSGVAIEDDAKNQRIPAIEITYDESPAIRGVKYQVYPVNGGALAASGSALGSGSAVISEGILPAATYDLVLTPISDVYALPIIVEGVTVPDIRLTAADFSDVVVANLAAAASARADHDALVEGFSHANLAELEVDYASVAQASDVIQGIALDGLPSTFGGEPEAFSHDISGQPTSKGGMHPDFALVDGSNGKKHYEIGPVTANRHLAPKGYIRAVEGRTYRVSIRAKALMTGTHATRFTVLFRSFGADYTAQNATYPDVGYSAIFNASDTWQTFAYNYTVTASNAGALLLPFAYVHNVSMVSGEKITFESFLIEDVTGVIAAENAASAAVASASTATTKAGEAGASALSATEAKNTATTKAGEASTSALNAASSATDADGSKSIALSAQEVAVRVASQGQGVLKSAYLDDYLSWGDFVTGPTWTDNEVYPVGRTARWNIADNVSAGIRMSSLSSSWVGVIGAKAYRVEIEFTLESGSISGAGILFDWNAGAVSKRTTVALSDMVDGNIVIGQRTVASAVIERPDGTSDAITDHTVHVMASYVGARHAKKLAFHNIQFMPATVTDATVNTQASAIADLEGNASAGYLIKAQAGGQVSLLDLIAADGSAGSASVAKLSADVIILDGTVTADQLAVGFGANALSNTDFLDGVTGWYLTGTGGAHQLTTMSVRPAGSTWAGVNYPTMSVYQSGASTDGYSDVIPSSQGSNDRNGLMEVKPGEYIEASVKVSVHRCQAQLRIQFLDAAGSHIAYTSASSSGVNVASWSTNPSRWPPIVKFAQAPADAALARFHLRKMPSTTGGDSYLFFHQPQLCPSVPNATTPAPYSNKGGTLLSGDRIITNTIYADKVNTASFAVAGMSLFGGTLKSTNYSFGASGWSININGDAQFNNLIVRGSLVVGSVSDGGLSVLYPSGQNFTGLPSNATFKTGPWTSDNFWTLAWSIETRHRRWFDDPQSANKTRPTRVAPKYRVKKDGVWQDWEWFAGGHGSQSESFTVWKSISFTQILLGSYDDVEMGFDLDTNDFINTPPPSPAVTFDNINIRNVTFIAKAIMR